MLLGKKSESFSAMSMAIRTSFFPSLYNRRIFDFIVPSVDIHTNPLAGSTLITFIETSLFQMKMKITIPMAEIPLITVTHSITSLNNLYTGVAQRNITYFRRKFCHICQGTGNVKHVPPERVKCPHCVGTRHTWKQILHQNTFAQWSYSLCDHCAGQGYVLVSFTTPTNRCPVCYGLGYAYAEDFVLVDLPPSLTNGTEYLLQYFGHEYEGYPQAGDVLVKFEHQLLASHSLQLHNTFDVLYTHTIQHLSQLIPSSSSSSSSSNSDCKLSFKCLP